MQATGDGGNSLAFLDDDDWEPDPEVLKKLQERYKGQQYPLFLDELPPDWESNPHYAAIHALLYDEQTPEERINGFRAQGNELYAEALQRKGDPQWRKQNLRDAIKCYSQAIAEQTAANDVQSILLSNRAMARLSLGDYIDCVDDSRSAIKLDPSNVKAYYRAGRASALMHLWRQSEHFCQEGLKQDPENEMLLKLHAEAKSQAEAHRQRRQKENALRKGETLSAKEVRRRKLQQGYEKRKLKVSHESDYDVSALDINGRLFYDDQNDVIHWPCLVLYPEYNISEVILDFADNTCLDDHMAVMFSERAPWDEEGKYIPDNLQVFLEPGFADGSVVEMDTSRALREVLSRVGQIAKVPVFHVVVRHSSAARNFLEGTILNTTLKHE